jgi:hypothetical protein
MVRYWEFANLSKIGAADDLGKTLGGPSRQRTEQALDEIIMPPLTAPDPKEKEIAAANRAIEQAKRKKAKAKLPGQVRKLKQSQIAAPVAPQPSFKKMADQVNKTTAVALGHTLPTKPKQPKKP